MYQYKTKGTCSTGIEIDIEGDIVKAVRFVRGCKGNTQGVARLAAGRTIDELIATLDGIECQNGTSCPDQLAKALKAYKGA